MQAQRQGELQELTHCRLICVIQTEMQHYCWIKERITPPFLANAASGGACHRKQLPDSQPCSFTTSNPNHHICTTNIVQVKIKVSQCSGIFTFLSFSPPGVKSRTSGHVRSLHRHQTELKDGLILKRFWQRLREREATNTSGSAGQQIVFHYRLQL